MDVVSLSDAPWQHDLAGIIVLLGLALLWRGLRGGPSGDRGLLRRRARTLGRVEGWRLTALGLTLVGLGAASIWEARWLLFLSLGFGFVEVLEASAIIAAWRWDGGRAATSARRAPPSRMRPGQTGGRSRPVVG